MGFRRDPLAGWSDLRELRSCRSPPAGARFDSRRRVVPKAIRRIFFVRPDAAKIRSNPDRLRP